MRRPAYRGLLALALASADAALQRVTSLPGAIHLQGKHYSGYLDIDGSDLGVLKSARTCSLRKSAKPPFRPTDVANPPTAIAPPTAKYPIVISVYIHSWHISSYSS